MSNKENKTPEQKAKTKELTIMLISLVICSVVVCGTYRLMLDFYYFELVLFGYIAVETILIAIYVIYNRGFSRKGVTVDMLPSDWSDEKKNEFVQSAKTRLRKTRWLLVIILAFLFTFAVDVLELVVLPMIFDLIGI